MKKKLHWFGLKTCLFNSRDRWGMSDSSYLPLVLVKSFCASFYESVNFLTIDCSDILYRDSHYGSGRYNHGVDIELVRSQFGNMSHASNASIIQKVSIHSRHVKYFIHQGVD